MSDGITHEKFAVGGLIALTATATIANLLYDYPTEVYYLIPGAAFAFLIDSDMMDQHQVTTHGERRLYKFWPLGFIVECYTYPLARLLSHRSIFSHLPGLCSMVRLLYFCAPVLYFLYGIDAFSVIWNDYQTQLIYFLLGSIIMDSIHAALDRFNFVW